MRRKPRSLPVLLGLATVAVVAHHSTGMILPVEAGVTHLPVQHGTVSYYFWLLINQLCLFCLPAFFFISGFFVSYAARGDPPALSWKVVRGRLVGLLSPYLLWSLVVYLFQLAQGEGSAPLAYLQHLARRIALPRVFDLFFFVPVLCQFYLLSPLIARFAKKRPGLLLTVSSFLQLLTMVLFYLRAYGVAVPRWIQLVVDNEVATFAKWAVFFPLGAVCYFHRRSIKQALGRFKGGLFAMTAVLGALSVVEPEITFAIMGYWRWAREQTKLSSVLFALAFILLFVVVDRVPLLGARGLEEAGKRSLGVYLLHGHLMLRLVPALRNHVSWLYDHQVLFQPLVVGVGVALPILLMTMVAKSPARRFYRQLFG